MNATTLTQCTRCKVLVVEDNVLNQIVATMLLERIGCEVDVVENGAVAVDAVQKKRYSAVFMDLRMPVMDGYEATRAIRDLGGLYGKLPIVAVTASIEEGVREACHAAGMDDYHAKPLRRASVERLVKKYVKDR